MRQTNNLNVAETQPLQTPDELKAELPITRAAAELVYRAREEIRCVLRGRDRRVLVIVGPCSIHDVDAAKEYASRLAVLRDRYQEQLLVVMRVYFEKPRTTVGWKGLINDPYLNGSHDIPSGLKQARRLFLDLAQVGMPAATEMLDPIIPQYLADLVTWTAIGARTTESQTHREMASGLSMPVGFKNGTDGGLTVAINAMIAASRSHHFLGIDGSGRVSLVRTSGNVDGHIVLRGGNAGPNYSPEHVATAAALLKAKGVQPRMLIDCSHDNSGKDYFKQPEVLEEVSRQLAAGSEHILGVMVESNLVAGRQDFSEGMAPADLVYGQSITDACVDFDTTERMLEQLAGACARRAPAFAATAAASA
ncbi:MAG TPA: 3-deoxy-7-phosphoheptulonate synthase [Polyangiaceae bacterium]|nr:3-deoxy-7-phosphoheptulonate synthase [Polyangiaceae bacterium]